MVAWTLKVKFIDDSPHIAQCSSNFYISNKLLDELTLFSAVYKLSSVHALRGYKGFTF